MAKKRRKNPWPFDLPVNPENDALASLPDDHPAKIMLMAHARCRMTCAGREIPWQGRENEAFDQEFHSAVRGRRMTFSGIIYMCVCFELVATEWMHHPPYMTDHERALLEHLPKGRAMLRECREAAERDENHRVLELLPNADAFFAAWEESVRARLREDRIPLP